MQLDSSHERMLRGEEGEAKQRAMEVLTKMGDTVGADSLVPIKSAHVLAQYSSLRDAGLEMLERFADAGGKFAVPTTVNPASVDLEKWGTFGVSEEYAEKQFRLCRAYGSLGGIPCWTCVQYQVCNFPKPDECVAWAEPSSVVFANSLIGCRTNMISSGQDIACAVAGLTPRFGMLLDENRTAGVAFRFVGEIRSELDYRSIGFFIGRTAGTRVPALQGLPASASSDDLKHLGAAAAASGQVAMIHYVGVTRGSPTVREAAGGEAVEAVDITSAELREVEGELNQTNERPDLVAVGVPHLSVSELGLLAKMMKGRKLRAGVKMYVYTSSQACDLAVRSGIAKEIESTGARLSHTTDAEISPLREMGFATVMTNSAKMAAVSSEGAIKTRYLSLGEILREVTG